MAAGRIGDAGEQEEVFSGLWQASHNGHIIKIPGAGLDSGG